MASRGQPVLAVEDGKIVKLFNSVRGGLPFRIGHLYTILRNHVYRGEIKHKGEIHAGDHQPIIDQALWDQAQAQLASNVAIRRSGKSSKDPSLLAGLLFDGEGNRMTPSHTVKKGVRYRYYVSRAVLDGDRDKAGCVSRVPAAELETLILQTLHQHAGLSILDSADGGRALINNLQRAVLEKDVVVLHLKPVSDEASPIVLRMPWTPPVHKKTKGITRGVPESGPLFDESAREILLSAISKARGWMDNLAEDRLTIGKIAELENKSARHIRLLLPLAFVPPSKLEAIADGRIVSGTTVTGLAQRVGYVWPKLDPARAPGA